MLMRLLWHWLILLFGLYLLTLITPLGIKADTLSDLAWAALVLILVNTFIKPLLILISLPLVLLTLGLFLLIINAIILYTLPHFVTGFHVPNFFSAFFGSLLLSLITGFFTGYEKRASARRRRMNANAAPPRARSSISSSDLQIIEIAVRRPASGRPKFFWNCGPVNRLVSQGAVVLRLEPAAPRMRDRRKPGDRHNFRQQGSLRQLPYSKLISN